jgi:twitching motility protein PilT
LHISVGYPPVVRIDGQLEEISEDIIDPVEAEELILPLMSDDKRELLEVNKEIDFAHTYEGKYNGRFRINAFYAMRNLSAAFRLIPNRIRTIEELKLPQIYHQFAKLRQGLILVTGPTGHGKSTTIAAMIEDINRSRFSRIITIEDPVEYVFQGKKSLIDQREMGQDTHSWPIALKSAMRQDPDVILVGEMRDYETISSAITLAETGHLVFATLHTNNSAQSIDRMIDVFPEEQQAQIRTQLSNILEVVIAQRLIPLDSGGRRAVAEILVVNPAIKTLIRESKTHQIDNVIRTSSDVGMISLERSLVDLVREGVINTKTAQEFAVYPEEVSRLLKS